MREDLGYAFLIFRRTDYALLGGLSISNVRRGVAQAASLGYWIGVTHVGQGHMTDAVKAVLPFAFVTLGLHRLEAACLPHNHASTRVLQKIGFAREGLARRYLKINGVWQDHDLFALLLEDTRK
jgi:ribosomal-protein-alanine N-acetyltransferase